jgi:hypothetical protein
MSGCLENLRLPQFEWMQVGDRRNKVASIAAGILVNLIEVLHYLFFTLICQNRIIFVYSFQLFVIFFFSSSADGGLPLTQQHAIPTRSNSRMFSTFVEFLEQSQCSCKFRQKKTGGHLLLRETSVLK